MNTTEIVDYVRELGSLPDGRFSGDQILKLANGEISNLYMAIMSVREDYMIETVTMSGTQFRIPPRASGQKIRDIHATQGTNFINIPRIDMSNVTDDAVGYYYKGNQVYMNRVNDQVPNLSFKVSYYARPGLLVDVSSSAQCAAISASGSVWTGARLSGTTYDVIKGTSGFETMSASLAVSSSIAGASYPYTSTLSVVIGGLDVGDYLSAVNTTPVPQLPDEFHTALCTLTIARCLDSIGDNEGFARAVSKSKEQIEDAVNAISERDDGRPEKLRLDAFSPWIYGNRRWRA